jgi:hypothetical protein
LQIFTNEMNYLWADAVNAPVRGQLLFFPERCRRAAAQACDREAGCVGRRLFNTGVAPQKFMSALPP